MVSINGTSFNLYNYQKTAEGVELTILGSTTSSIEAAIGDAADIVISDEFRGYGMKVTSIFKEYGEETKHTVCFRESSLSDAVRQNTSDIEMNAEAIIELAEIVGGSTEEESEEA